MADTKDNLKDFEKSLQQLEKIVGNMESGELGLQDSLEQFEKGIKLSRECQQALTDAEQKVQVLLGEELKEDPDA